MDCSAFYHSFPKHFPSLLHEFHVKYDDFPLWSGHFPSPGSQIFPNQSKYRKNHQIFNFFITFFSCGKSDKIWATSSKVINFDKEEINVLKEAQGKVLSKGTISIVGLPDEYK